MAKKKSTTTLSYQEALSQLEEIVSSMEEEQPDIDALAEKVKKALELLEMCKGKLRNTEDTLNQAFEKE
jgi:exodeoxyribonuclease VII small subunit